MSEVYKFLDDNGVKYLWSKINLNIEDKADKNDVIITPPTAQIGQTIIVKSVDAEGRPTEWETTNFVQGDGLSAGQIAAIDALFKKCKYMSSATEEYEAFKLAFGITEGELEQDQITITYDELSELLQVSNIDFEYNELEESGAFADDYVSYNASMEELTIGGN